MPEAPLTILIADDSDTDRLILESFVRDLGHRVVSARDGVEALERYRDAAPDIILLDALMPRKNGFEVAEVVKTLSGQHFVPIIFLTALTEADALARCLEAGGDDFLTKPYNSLILQAKINAFWRMAQMHNTLQQQRDEIARHNQRLLQDQEVAKRIFDRVAHPGSLQAGNLRYSLSPMAVFNGDVLLVAWQPSGNLLVLLGDFTGHGLAAAVGAMPLAQTFYGMAEKGFALSQILRELNGKLREVLPTDVFCCACVVDLDIEHQTLEVWNGGLPEARLLRSESGAVELLPSRHLPLGILATEAFDPATEMHEMATGDRVLLLSDGILEATNAAGEMFGETRLSETLAAAPPEAAFDRLRAAVRAFVGASERSDDLSLVDLRMLAPGERHAAVADMPPRELQGPADWALEYRLNMDSLRRFNPLPLLQHILMDVPGLRAHAGDVYTILSELYSNALEHGVAGLESSLKATHDGFVRYYEERDRRLTERVDGFISVGLAYRGDDDGGTLTVEVTDSGPGFTPADAAMPPGEKGFAGRGLPLVRALCRELTVLPPGNKVRARYDWRSPLARD